MTEIQLQILQELTSKIREHFPAALLVVEGEGDDLAPDQVTYRTAGTWSSALGLCKYAEHELLNRP